MKKFVVILATMLYATLHAAQSIVQKPVAQTTNAISEITAGTWNQQTQEKIKAAKQKIEALEQQIVDLKKKYNESSTKVAESVRIIKDLTDERDIYVKSNEDMAKKFQSEIAMAFEGSKQKEQAQKNYDRYKNQFQNTLNIFKQKIAERQNTIKNIKTITDTIIKDRTNRIEIFKKQKIDLEKDTTYQALQKAVDGTKIGTTQRLQAEKNRSLRESDIKIRNQRIQEQIDLLQKEIDAASKEKNTSETIENNPAITNLEAIENLQSQIKANLDDAIRELFSAMLGRYIGSATSSNTSLVGKATQEKIAHLKTQLGFLKIQYSLLISGKQEQEDLKNKAGVLIKDRTNRIEIFKKQKIDLEKDTTYQALQKAVDGTKIGTTQRLQAERNRGLRESDIKIRNQRIQEQIDLLQKDIDTATEETSKRQQAINNLIKRLEDNKSEMQAIESQLQGEIAAITKSSSQSLKQAKLQEIQAQIDSLTKNSANFQQKINEKTKELSTRQQSIPSLNQQVADLQRKLTGYQQTQSPNKTVINQMQSQLTPLKEKLTQATKNIEKLNQDIAALNQQKSDNDQQIKNLKKAIEPVVSVPAHTTTVNDWALGTGKGVKETTAKADWAFGKETIQKPIPMPTETAQPIAEPADTVNDWGFGKSLKETTAKANQQISNLKKVIENVASVPVPTTVNDWALGTGKGVKETTAKADWAFGKETVQKPIPVPTETAQPIAEPADTSNTRPVALENTTGEYTQAI